MDLLEAEAYANMNNVVAAKQALDALAKKRNTAYTFSGNTREQLLVEIKFQRRIELWGEGFRFYDLKRLDLPLDRSRHPFLLSYQQKAGGGSQVWQFAIPQSEIDATRGVVEQNPL
jgi:hypothetical protein